MIQSLLSYLLLLLCALLAVSFYTLMERKVLGMSHLRLGPDVVSSGGLLQPFSDGLKLFSKEFTWVYSHSFVLYWVSPVFMVGLSAAYLSLWSDAYFSVSWDLSAMALLIYLGWSIYPIIWMGWSPSSPWSLLGAIRSVAQAVSFEVSLAFIMFSFILLLKSPSFTGPNLLSGYAFFYMVPLCTMWLFCILVELNRSPFDLGEAESELISGLNIEYSGGLFGLVFISEYLNMITFSILSVVLGTGLPLFSFSALFLVGALLYFLVWVRVTVPRVRYDKLMQTCWMVLLPVSILLLISMVSLLM